MIFDITTPQKLDKHHQKLVDEVFGKKSFLAFIHADWCGHCVRFLPEWRKFVKQMREEKIPNFAVLDISDVTMNHVMSEKPESFLAKLLEKAVSGFPTLIFVDQHMTTAQKAESLIHNFNQFSQERTAAELKRFVKTKIKERKQKDAATPKRSQSGGGRKVNSKPAAKKTPQQTKKSPPKTRRSKKT